MHTEAARERPRGYGQRLVAGAVVLACLYLASPLVMTVVVSLLLVFLCDPAVTWMTRHGLPRGLGAFLMVLFLLGMAYLLFYLFYAQAQNFVQDFPKYSTKLGVHVLRFRLKAEQFQKQTKQAIGEQPETVPPKDAPTDWTGSLGAGLRSFTEVLFMVSFIPFLVFFLLTWKDHIRRNSIAIFGVGNRVAAERTLDGITLMIRAFVLGNVIIGGILSVLSGLFFWFMHLPYPAVMGPVSGFLSIVPYLGVLLAALPPVLAAVGQFDTLAPLIAILSGVAGMHIFALNVLYPKLIGSRVHLNPVVVTVSLMFWGWLWGAMGLLLAVPITGGIKAICDNVPALRPYGRLMAD